MADPVRTLLIVPPFASIHWPAHGIHVLQSVAREQGLQVEVLYANLMFAALLGEEEYEAICDYPVLEFLGERIMGWFLGNPAESLDLERFNQERSDKPPLTHARLQQVQASWLAQVITQVLGQPGPIPELPVTHPPPSAWQIIGVSSTFDQTNACRLLLRACKQALPNVITVIGGANCDDVMAQGMASYLPEAEHVFSGESELQFVQFLHNPLTFAGQRIVRSEPNNRLDALPVNDYSEFLCQFARYLPDSPARLQLELSYESSRGCWWGQKHHCTFCGLNRDGIAFREKSAAHVLADLQQLKQQGASRILMSDYIMPNGFYKTLLPELAKAPPGLQIFYEIKANIDLDKAILLKQAGVDRIQPGIEALHSASLRLMNKGVRARQNIALLRHARALHIHVLWNLLYGFPGEQESWYAEVLQLMPLLAHLQPPSGFNQIIIDRFSPYFTAPERYGFSNIRPHPSYAAIFPDHPDLSQMAYHFSADLPSPTLADSPLLAPLQTAVTAWQQGWHSKARPALVVMQVSSEQYLLIDSRSLHPQAQTMTISRAQARACLLEQTQADSASDWAIAHQVAVEYDGVIMPLAVAAPAIWQQLEAENREQKKAAPEGRVQEGKPDFVIEIRPV